MKRTTTEQPIVKKPGNHNNGVCPGLKLLSKEQLAYLYQKICNNITNTKCKFNFNY